MEYMLECLVGCLCRRRRPQGAGPPRRSNSGPMVNSKDSRLHVGWQLQRSGISVIICILVDACDLRHIGFIGLRFAGGACSAA
eukprot:scaffold127391_cov32-Tisochrysis_lutea.AAC.2